MIRVFVVQQDDAGGRLGDEAAEFFLQRALLGSKFFNLLLYPVPERDVAFAMDDAFEHRLHGIEILLGNGVELMVVASGAPNCQAKESGTGHSHHVGQFVGPLLLPEQRIFTAHDILGASHQESGGGVCPHRIPGKLFKDKAVVGLVLVESPDYIVTVVV